MKELKGKREREETEKDRQSEKETDRQTARQTDSQTYRQSERERERERGEGKRGIELYRERRKDRDHSTTLSRPK